MNIIELKNITKRFGTVVANDGIDLNIEKGRIHCLLGENGAGKTTLVKILFGLYRPDRGEILLNGKPVRIKGPSQAIKLGIGMIHQNFMLVEGLSVAENVVAGRETRKGIFIDKAEAKRAVLTLSETLGARLDPDAKIENISIGERQRVEIVKALYRNADILILDEPTAVLTPGEVEELFIVLRKLKKTGKTILFITHKLKETLALSDRVTVLRDGKKVGSVKPSETAPEELAKMMVGREVVLKTQRKDRRPGNVVLETKNLAARRPSGHIRLSHINISLRAGEIFGIAGVEGNGQFELEEVLMGLVPVAGGEIRLDGRDIGKMSTGARRRQKMGHIPSDRLKRGLVASQNIEKNILLGSEWKRPFSRWGLLSRKAIRNFSLKVVTDFDIRCSGITGNIDSLSGGNQQKLVIGRELSADPRVIIAAHPTRGVDIGAVEYIHHTLLEMRDQNKGILLISSELDELMTLCDRIAVMYEGKIIAEGSDFKEEELGLLMAGQQPAGESDAESGSGF
jgi:simple sugar transport system ATP-binding protein